MIYIIGLVAQAFFSARMFSQWILSEKTKKVVSPAIYWIFSIMGAYLLCIYGWLRDDFSIILGQFIAYYIYIWNLNEKGLWKKLHWLVRIPLFVTPVLAAAFVLKDAATFVDTFFKSDNVPLWLLLFGSAGQVIFTLRFVYQWYYSHKLGESVLPVGFWVISLAGSSIITLYGIIRHDPILILGQSTGFFVYSRNIFIYRKQLKNKTVNDYPHDVR